MMDNNYNKGILNEVLVRERTDEWLNYVEIKESRGESLNQLRQADDTKRYQAGGWSWGAWLSDKNSVSNTGCLSRAAWDYYPPIHPNLPG